MHHFFEILATEKFPSLETLPFRLGISCLLEILGIKKRKEKFGESDLPTYERFHLLGGFGKSICFRPLMVPQLVVLINEISWSLVPSSLLEILTSGFFGLPLVSPNFELPASLQDISMWHF
ncbi:hypothetical protein J6590_021121 [Homalodisca vitripennis]|nr:hypothetical protein J6590_021121 [Homalodisca vitripennis]